MTMLNSKKILDLESFIFKRMGDSGIVGLSIALIEDNKITYKKGFGFRDFIQGSSATPETIYCIGSVTKTFTALGIMQLHEKGILNINDPINKYIPFKSKAKGEEVLIKHVLSHSSGFSALGYAEATLGMVTGIYDRWFPIASPQDLLMFMNGAEDWAIAKPGEHHAYLNEGYIILGSIIEKASGTSYPDYIKENILKPLGMNKSTFKEEDIIKEKDVATPYITSESGAKVATRYPYGQMIADGGLMSNADEMVRYIRALLSKGTLEGVKIVNAETINEIMEPKIKISEIPVDGKNHRYYGYGLRIKSDFLGYKLVHHSGSVYGSSAYINMIPEKGLGVVILANGGYFLEDMGEYAMALLLDKNPYEIQYFKRSKILDSLTGTYWTFRNTSNYKINRSGGILQLQSSFGQRVYSTPLIPVDIDSEVKTFYVYGLDTITPIQFVEKDGIMIMVYERTLAKRI